MQFTRRNFLQLGFGAVAASSIAPFSFGVANEQVEQAKKAMKIQKFVVKVGATQPFKALHISDTHITFADERETERKQELAKNRARYFRNSVAQFNAAVEYAKEQNALLLHTGDFIDFVSEGNYEFVEKAYANISCDHFNSSGNHEFSHYLGEAKEDEAYKALSFERTQRAFPNDLKFCSKIHNGVNFIAFDDVYYYVADNLIELFQKEIDKGLPIVTLCHIPFYTPELYRFMLVEQKESKAYVIGATEEAIKEYKQEHSLYQRGNQATLEFIDWLKKQALVKALLCGHLHVPHVDQFSETATQYSVGANYKGEAFEFTFE